MCLNAAKLSNSKKHNGFSDVTPNNIERNCRWSSTTIRSYHAQALGMCLRIFDACFRDRLSARCLTTTYIGRLSNRKSDLDVFELCQRDLGNVPGRRTAPTTRREDLSLSRRWRCSKTALTFAVHLARPNSPSISLCSLYSSTKKSRSARPVRWLPSQKFASSSSFQAADLERRAVTSSQ